MKSTDEATLLEWLDMEADGTLATENTAALRDGLAARPDLLGEQRLLGNLHALLAESKIDVRSGFAAQVTAALPASSWASQSHQAWRLPLAVAVGFAALAAMLLAGTSVLQDGTIGTFAAVADFFQTATLAGAGMLGATWQGVTLAFDELLVTSKASLIALTVGVLFLDLLFLRMLRRRPRSSVAHAGDDATPLGGGDGAR